jgi:hypothetical protein
MTTNHAHSRERELMLILLSPDMSDKELFKLLRPLHEHKVVALKDLEKMKECYPVIAITIYGFDSDSRELYQIPEARDFCRRLVDLGFIIAMEASTQTTLGTADALGALETWLIAEGLCEPTGACLIDAELRREFLDVVLPRAEKAAALAVLEGKLEDPFWVPTRSLADRCPCCNNGELIPIHKDMPVVIQCEFCRAEWTAGGNPVRFAQTRESLQGIQTFPDDGPNSVLPGGNTVAAARAQRRERQRRRRDRPRRG